MKVWRRHSRVRPIEHPSRKATRHRKPLRRTGAQKRKERGRAATSRLCPVHGFEMVARHGSLRCPIGSHS